MQVLGWVAALPALQQHRNWHCTVLYCTVLYCTVLYCTVHRNWHGCGAFVTAGGEPALLVAGGWDTPNLAFLDSAEVLVGGAGAGGWVFTTPLPRPLAYPRAVSFDNRVLLLGGGNRPTGGALQADLFNFDINIFTYCCTSTNEPMKIDVKIGYLQAYPDVLMWEAGAEQWVVLGGMLQPRLSHAAATIELTQELLSNCS